MTVTCLCWDVRHGDTVLAYQLLNLCFQLCDDIKGNVGAISPKCYKVNKQSTVLWLVPHLCCDFIYSNYLS